MRLSETDKKELPWGLYTNNKDDILNQRLIPEKMDKPTSSNNSELKNSNGNVVIQGINSTEGGVTINVNLSNQAKDLKTLAIEKILEEFSNSSITSFKTWISPFLFDGDSMTKRVLTSNKKRAMKAEILDLKLDELLEEPSFKHALQIKLGRKSDSSVSKKNVIEDTEIEAKGDFRVGDTNVQNIQNYGTKNAIIGSKIKVGKDFRLGDD